jgi:hypothetical protein
MYGSELRACALGAVGCVALGAGIGFGWNLPGHRGERAAVAIRRRTRARYSTRRFDPNNVVKVLVGPRA